MLPGDTVPKDSLRKEPRGSKTEIVRFLSRKFNPSVPGLYTLNNALRIPLQLTRSIIFIRGWVALAKKIVYLGMAASLKLELHQATASRARPVLRRTPEA